MKGLHRIGAVLRVAVTLLLAILLLCNLYLLAAQRLLGQATPTVFGFTTAVVLSGSMEPVLSVDDLIVIQTRSGYAPGDIVTYESGSNLVTHRIVDTTADGFITQGDANNAPDAQPVAPDCIVGKVVVSLPGAGLLLTWLKTPLGMTCLVFLGILLIELPFFLQRTHRNPKEEGGQSK